MDSQMRHQNQISYQLRRSALMIGLTVAGALLGAFSLTPARPALLWNFTASVPIGLYRIGDTPPQPGDLVALDPTGAAKSALMSFGVLAKDRLLLKPIVAHAGDTVCRHSLTVTVNGFLAAKARPRTREGRLLPEWGGCWRLASSEIFLLAPHPDSFDSRYFGPVGLQDVIGVAHPLLTFLPSSGEAA